MKKAANLSLDAELLAEAKALDINLSQTLEEALRRTVAEAQGMKWKAENRDALEGYNDWVTKNGLPLARYRRF
jgi:antitoxin CcdA